MEKKLFDVVVIGAGPGGYVAAIKASQMGKKVAIVEKNALGGVCLNVGCIPTKTLLAGTSVLHKIKTAGDFGISVGQISFDFAKMKTRKDKVVEGLRKGVAFLMQQNGIEVIQGEAQFASKNELKVGKVLLKAEKIIIATGSEPIDVKTFPCDHKRILNSTSILELQELPKSLVIIGGGYIGCEFASLYAELGVQVTIVEALGSILSLLGTTVSSFMTDSFQKQGIQMVTNALVEGIENNGKKVTVKLKGGKTVEADLALVAIGRKINSDKLGLEKALVTLGKKGEIIVDERLETSTPGIYAIGDVTGIGMLAHVASEQGVVAATNACGGDAVIHYDAIPAVVFTHPEVAMVGLTAEQAKEKGYNVTATTFPFSALGKALAARESDGFAQIIADPKTGQIFGAIVIGYEASTLIAEMTLAIQNELTLDSIMDTIHAHPTISEAWHEAAFMAYGTPLNFPPKKKA